MECLNTLIGLRGGCADIAADASLYLNTKVTYQELSAIIDQNDYASVDDFFTELRETSVQFVLAEIQNHMREKYITRTVINQQILGNYSNGLTASAAAAIYKGLLIDRCTDYPKLGYRITSVGFIGSYTGNVVVKYIDGLTAEQLATDTISATNGVPVHLSVNRLFNVQNLLIVYDATGIGGYETRIDYGVNGCVSCSKWRVNKHATARPITAPLATPLSETYVSEMGGLMVSVSMECDHESWLCGIKQQVAIPILYKIAESAMEYAVTNSSRGNTKTMRDYDKLKERHGFYKAEYESAIKTALMRVILPNDPICFHCQKRNGIYQSIP